MKNNTNTTKVLLITGLIFAVVIFRIIPHPFNFTPVLAMSLFAGAKLNNKKWSILIPVAALFLSDIILSFMNNYPLFHNTIFFVYGAIILTVLMGWNLSSNKLQVGKTAILTIISSVLFFVITNLGVWMFSNLYSLDTSGLINCFAMAIPFFKYSLLGDAFFVAVLFGAYQWIASRYNLNNDKLAYQKSQL